MEHMDIRDRLFDLAMASVDAIDETTPPQKCPDEDLLSAFVEDRLDIKARLEVEGHLASCPRCRKLVAELMKIAGEDQGGKVIRFPAIPRPLLAAAAAVILVFGAYTVMKATGTLPWARPELVAIVTEEEAALPETRGLIFEVTQGPAVELISPREGEVATSPLTLDIVFKPGASGLPPDIGTLSVIYRKKDGIDITERFIGHIRGDEILIEKASFPPGEHKLLFSIRDTGGNETAKSVIFRIE